MLTQSAHWMNYFNERRGIKKTNAMYGNVKTSFTWSDWAYEPLEADYIIKTAKQKPCSCFMGHVAVGV